MKKLKFICDMLNDGNGVSNGFIKGVGLCFLCRGTKYILVSPRAFGLAVVED